MHALAPEAAATGPGPAAAAALLDWWKLAGVDTQVGAEPASWFAAPPPAAARPAPAAATVRAPAGSRWADIPNLADLIAAVRAETPRAVLADGNPASGLMILGESPSAEDLKTGRPFTGPAGLFLDRMLAAIGIDRTSSYISLVCPRQKRPGPPEDADIAADLDLTLAHIRLAAPRHILLLGANPVKALTGETAPITRVRGSWLSVGGLPALATFNPAFLLHRVDAGSRAAAWADLLALKRRLSS